MKFYIGLVLLLSLFSGVFRSCEKNEAISKTYQFSLDSLYDSASVGYQLAIDSFQVKDSIFLYDYALNQFLKQDTVKTLGLFQQLEKQKNDTLALKSNNQIGIYYLQKAGVPLKFSAENVAEIVQTAKKSDIETAIDYFKKGLRIAPQDDLVRYNFELANYLLSVLNKEDQNQDKNKDNKDQNKDQKDQDKKDQEKKDQDQNKDGKNDQNKDQNNKENQDKGKDKEGKDKEGKDKEGKDKEGKDKEGKDKDSKNQDQKGKDGKENQDKKDPKSGEEGKEGKDKQDKQGKQQNAAEAKKEQEAKEKAAQQKMINDRLKQQNMSREQAEMLLKQSQEQNKKYLQQVNKRPQGSNKNKPDW